jgi:hypothetical protein
MKPEKSSLTLWSEMWKQDPLHSLAMLIIDPEHLDHHPTIVHHLVEFYSYDVGFHYFSDPDKWEIFHGEWFEDYAYNRLEGITEEDAAARLERLFQPLLLQLCDLGSTRPLLRNLVDTLLRICPTFEFSSLTPLHHLDEEEYLKTLVRHNYGKYRNHIFAFLRNPEFTKRTRHLLDFGHYCARGLFKRELHEFAAHSYVKYWRQECRAQVSNLDFFDQFDEFLSREFGINIKETPALESGLQKTHASQTILLELPKFPATIAASDQLGDEVDLSKVLTFSKLRYEGFTLHSGVTLPPLDRIVVIRVEPHEGFQCLVLSDVSGKTSRGEYTYLPLSDDRERLDFTVKVTSEKEDEIFEDCLLCLPTRSSSD